MFSSYDNWKTRSDRDDSEFMDEFDDEYEEEEDPHSREVHSFETYFPFFDTYLVANTDPFGSPEWFEQYVVAYFPDYGPPAQIRRFYLPFKS